MGLIQTVNPMRAVQTFFLAACFAATGAVAQPTPPDLSEPNLYELLLGEIALQRGDAPLAARTYLDLAKRLRDPRIAQRAIEVANQARLPDLALEGARLWHDIEPESMQALQFLAALLVASKRVEEAEPYLEKVLTAPGVAIENGFMQLNRLLASNPDKASNLRVVTGLANRHQDLPQAQFAVAQAALIAGDTDAAVAAARRAQEMRPDWEAAAVLEAQALQKKSPGEAIKRLAQFVDKNPGSRDARLAFARVLAGERRYAESRKQFEALLAANPGNPEVVYAVGVLAFQLKDYTVAEQNMKRLLGMGWRDPDAVRFQLGQIAEEQKQWPDAIKWYQQIESGEHAMAARMRTAHSMAKQGRLDDARSFLHKVADENPDQVVQVLVAEAQLLRDANRPREAYELLGAALEKQPEQPDLLYDYALTAEKLELFDVLESQLQKLIKVRPDHAHAYNALGYSFAERNTRLPEARKLVEKALELSPDDFFIIDSLGWVQYREGDLKGAAATLRRAYNGRPDAEIGAHLGEVLWVMGERAEAQRVWQEALKAGPDNETLQKTIKRLKR
jgi:tetratricopeptide (TPR) repeat protein